MLLYSDQLNQLSQWMVEASPLSMRFLSIYAANENNYREGIKQKIKSLITSAITESKTKLDTDVLADWINKEFDDHEILGQGLAIFADLEKRRTMIIDLTQKPINESMISDIVDMDQLVWMNITMVPNTIININNDEAKIYFGNGKLNLITTVPNNYTTSRQGRESVGHAASAPTTSTFGTGQDKIQKDKTKALEDFLNDIKAEIKAKKKVLEKSEMATVVATLSFDDIMEKFKTELKRMMPNYRGVVSITREIESENELKQTIDEEVMVIQIRKHDEEFIKAKEEGFDNFAEGWDEVLKAAADQKIDTLFVKMNLCKAGYINSLGEISVVKVEDGRKVRDISPWLIRKVMQTGGKVTVYPETNGLVDNVAAKLRY